MATPYFEIFEAFLTFYMGLCRGIFRDTIWGHAYVRQRRFSQNTQNYINEKGLRIRLLCFFSF